MSPDTMIMPGSVGLMSRAGGVPSTRRACAGPCYGMMSESKNRVAVVMGPRRRLIGGPPRRRREGPRREAGLSRIRSMPEPSGIGVDRRCDQPVARGLRRSEFEAAAILIFRSTSLSAKSL
jgi:hypothetical protein